MMRQKRGGANSKKASNKNHSISSIVVIKDVQKRGKRQEAFSHGNSYKVTG